VLSARVAWSKPDRPSTTPQPYAPGSFDEVVLAYDLGQLTDAGYAVLAEAEANK
jgi:hypothetical protein